MFVNFLFDLTIKRCFIAQLLIEDQNSNRGLGRSLNKFLQSATGNWQGLFSKVHDICPACRFVKRQRVMTLALLANAKMNRVATPALLAVEISKQILRKDLPRVCNLHRRHEGDFHLLSSLDFLGFRFGKDASIHAVNSSGVIFPSEHSSRFRIA